MNKTKLLLTLALPVLLCQNTHAQSRLTATAHWTHNGAEFMRTDSTAYNYLSTARGGDLKNLLKFDNATMWNFAGDTLNNDSRWVQEFDAANNLVSKVSQVWDAVLMTWTNQFKYIYTYNSANKKASMVIQHWDGTSAWITDSRNVYTYNAANQLSYDQYQLWDGVSAYVPSSQITYYYDPSGNVINETGNTFVSSTPVFTNKVDYTYNSANKMLSSTSATWNGAGWDNTEMYSYTYDTTNTKRTTEKHQTYDGTAFVNDMMKVYSNFSGTNPLTEVDQTWDTAGTGSWEDVYKFAYTYNSNGQLTSATRQSNDISIGWTYAFGDTRTNHYYGTFTSVKNVSNNAGNANLFPVPAQNSVNISLNWNTAQASTITLTDMMGRTIKTIAVPFGATQTVTMSVADLAAGNYIVSINGGVEGSIVKQIVVAH
ncbi:T9SS type A sorting domain-containing protein [Nemorincola caseinilytica]|uniref:T9SS type A sorting domain-containing protein n=1 Tax=Nemorincola caseinilytica TaxID=2054315 RepID=A0ABP8ND57_9BACT